MSSSFIGVLQDPSFPIWKERLFKNSMLNIQIFVTVSTLDNVLEY